MRDFNWGFGYIVIDINKIILASVLYLLRKHFFAREPFPECEIFAQRTHVPSPLRVPTMQGPRSWPGSRHSFFCNSFLFCPQLVDRLTGFYLCCIAMALTHLRCYMHSWQAFTLASYGTLCILWHVGHFYAPLVTFKRMKMCRLSIKFLRTKALWSSATLWPSLPWPWYTPSLLKDQVNA